jgi:carbamoyltransferase
MEHGAWGAEPDADALRTAAASSGFHTVELPNDDQLIERTVDLLARGRVIGWAQGRFEWGPRALGQRSILADPRRSEMKGIVNTKIKFREPYRPFAPSVLAERVSGLFELEDPARQYPARFMLLVVPVRECARARIPAVTHVDGSARIQAVVREASPLYYQLIERFDEATGVPVLLNTSFNLRGEPIVNTPAEALSTFSRSGMDALVVNHTILYRENA